MIDVRFYFVFGVSGNFKIQVDYNEKLTKFLDYNWRHSTFRK